MAQNIEHDLLVAAYSKILLKYLKIFDKVFHLSMISAAGIL